MQHTHASTSALRMDSSREPQTWRLGFEIWFLGFAISRASAEAEDRANARVRSERTPRGERDRKMELRSRKPRRAFRRDQRSATRALDRERRSCRARRERTDPDAVYRASARADACAADTSARAPVLYSSRHHLPRSEMSMRSRR